MLNINTSYHDGAMSADGQVAGCYMHGLFASDGFRAKWLARQGHKASDMVFEDQIETTLDHLADHLAEHLNMDAIAMMAGLK